MSRQMRRMDNFSEYHRKQIKEAFQRYPTVQATNMELRARGRPKDAHAPKKMDKRVCIRVHQKRRRLADIDGYCAKAAIDGLFRGGLIRDDGPEYVEAVIFSHEKSQVDETTITVEEI